MKNECIKNITYKVSDEEFNNEEVNNNIMNCGNNYTNVNTKVIFDNLRNIKIACIGNATFDMTVSGKEFIKEGLRNSYTNATFTAGGPASTAASVISKFGGNVDFYGQIGNDVNGRFVYEEMLKENIDLKNYYSI